MKLRCNHVVNNIKCGNIWNYKGNNPFYATCTKCHRKVKVS